MEREHKSWLAVIIWILLVLLALLLPSPREWGQLGDWLSPRYDRVVHIVQPVAHIVFMTVLAFLLMKCLERKPVMSRVATVAMTSVVIAIFFEAAQSFLPERFGRNSDLSDLIYALVGIGVGCVLGIQFEFVSQNGKNRNK